MASYGKVLDLLDDRYLNLQDVAGNVQPFPTLVPYEQYGETMIVYRIDTKHEFFMALIQDFTDRTARLSGNELWTWCIQWEVEEPPTNEPPGTPAAKKPRLTGATGASAHSQPSQPKPPAYTKVERRCLHPELFREAEMLRILIDIVQVDSRLVPNFVEFLYQWIDYYERDGTALKAALRLEIPSLWEFEYHPLPLWDKLGQTKNVGYSNSEPVTNQAKAKLDAEAQKIGESVSRQKPCIAKMEELTEKSERLQYREPKFGLQPPINPEEEPLPPLINIPRDSWQRTKYYAACFKNRQRAFWLLQEAGISARQIANYKKRQPEDPRETTEDGCGEGFQHYYKEEPYAAEKQAMTQKMKQLREKQKEIAISNRLAQEAKLAAPTSHLSERVPPPLIPPTPTWPGRPDFAITLLQKMQAMARKKDDPPIKVVPKNLHGKTKSKLFAHADPTEYEFTELRHSSQIEGWPWGYDASSESDEDDDEDSDEDDDDMDGMANYHAPHPSQSQPIPPPAPNVPTFLQGLNRTQLSSLVPLLNNRAQQNMLPGFTARQSSAPTQSSTRAAPPASLTLGLPQPGVLPVLPGVKRAASSPMPMTPLAGLAGKLSLRTPQAISPHGIPIHIYIPKIVLKDGENDHSNATDCLVLGYTRPGTQTFKFSKAIFLPVGIWQNILNRVRRNHAKVLESYPPPAMHPRKMSTWKGNLKTPDQLTSAHKHVYDKLRTVFSWMVRCEDREEEHTKRWRATPGPLTVRERGAVWEGWGVYVDKAIEMGPEERKGALVQSTIEGDGKGPQRDELAERRRKEIEELINEDENDDGEAMEE